MAIWYARYGGTGSAPGTPGAPVNIQQALGNLGGTKPARGDIVEVMGSTYAGRWVFNLPGTGAPITFRRYAAGGLQPVIDGRVGAVNGTAPSPITGWALANGTGILTYASGPNSGSSQPYVYYKDGFGARFLQLWADSYIASNGTLKSPGSDNWWWHSLWPMGPGDFGYNYSNGPQPNPNKRIHAVDGHISGNDDQGWNSAGSNRTEKMHDWRGQYYHDLAGDLGPSGRLYARFHTAGDMTGGSPAHTVHGSTNNSNGVAIDNHNDIILEGLHIRGWKRGVECHGSNRITLRDCTVLDTGRDCVQFGDLNGGSGHKIIDCTLHGGTPAEHNWGVILLETATDVLIEGCDLAFGGHHLIELKDCVRPVIRYNHLHHSGYGVNAKKSATNMLIEHNIFEMLGLVDITLIHKPAHGCIILGGGSHDAVIRRNKVKKCGHFLFKLDGGFQRLRCHNNSGQVEYASFYMDEYDGLARGTVRDMQWKNNAFEEIGDPVGAIEPKSFYINMLGAVSDNGWGNRIENNCEDRPSIADDDLVWGWDPEVGGSATQATIAEADAHGSWIGTVFSNNQDAAPNFVDGDGGDFALNVGSPCLNAGSATNLSGTLSLGGVTYPDHPSPSGTIDQGAFEADDDGEGGGGGPPPAGQAPTLHLIASSQQINVGDTVQFDSGFQDPDGDPEEAELVWYFGDPNDEDSDLSGTGLSSYGAPEFTFTQPGFFIVSLVVTDEEDLTAQASVGITVNPTAGGTLKTDYTGWTAVSSGTGGVDFDTNGDGTPDCTPDKLYDQAFNADNERWVRSGLTNPQTATLTAPSALADPVVQTILWPHRAVEGREHVVTVEWSDDDGETWNTVHPGATWKTLVGPNNPRTVIAHEPLVGLTDIRLTEHSNSEGSQYVSHRELQLVLNEGGGSPTPETPIPILEVWASDHEGLHTPERAANGVKPSALRPLETWHAYSVDAQPAWYCRRDTTESLKHLDLYLYWGESRTQTFNVATATDAVPGTPAGTWTSRLTAQTSATGQQKTRLTLSSAVADEFVRITVAATQFGKTAELAEVELFGE